MFNIGPLEFLVLAIVGLVVLGPDKLPGLTRDAARMIRTLREMATGAQKQLREELGPEFADVDLRTLNPRTAVQRAVFGDEMPDLRQFNPSSVVRDAILGAPETAETADAAPAAEPAVSLAKEPETAPVAAVTRPRPRPRPGPGAARPSYDDDAT